MEDCRDCLFRKESSGYLPTAEGCAIWAFIRCETLERMGEGKDCRYFRKDNGPIPLSCSQCAFWKSDSSADEVEFGCGRWNQVKGLAKNIDIVDIALHDAFSDETTGLDENVICPLFKRS